MSEDVRHIQVLSVALRTQIAAGEVVERPSSVVKELVENSLDAGARQIDCEIENGGQLRLVVQDDGCGIPGEELSLALTPHATSKLTSFSDLSEIQTRGFRGEALASIASVSRLTLTSCSGGQASSLSCIFGEMGEIRPSGLARGTRVEVQDLFTNVPARLKFLKSPATETRRVQEMLFLLSLARLDVGFRLRSAGREVLHFLPDQPLTERLAFSWPSQICDALRRVEFSRRGVRVHGLASVPQVTQLKGNRILLYVNGRIVSDKLLMGAVREAYRGRLTSRDFPQVVLFLEVDPREVDVNVHPAKSEVRFRNESLIFTGCTEALKQMLAGTESTSGHGAAEQREPGVRTKDAAEEPLRAQDAPRPQGFWGSLDQAPVIRNRFPGQDDGDPAEEWHVGHSGAAEESEETSSVTDRGAAYRPDFCPDSRVSDASAPVSGDTGDRERDQNAFSDTRGTLFTSAAAAEDAGTAREKNVPKASHVSFRKPLLEYRGQIACTYLLFQEEGEDLLILDQHAAHERVLYERLLEEVNGHQGQGLMMPFFLSLHQSECERFHMLAERLAAFGFELIRDGNRLKCQAIPRILSLPDARDFLRDCLDNVYEDNTAMLKSMACKGAIKAGQKLTTDEVNGLRDLWLATPNREFCPHGRPTVLRYSAATLERLFKRKQ